MFIDPGKKNAMPNTGYQEGVGNGACSAQISALPQCSSRRADSVPPCRGSRTLRRCGFTLLEIILAVAILGMMSLAIFRFVQTNLTALRVSSDINAAEAQYDGLRDLLTMEWQSLNPRRAGMKGEPFKLKDRQRDEISWNCSAGPGLLTRYAARDFTVSLRLQPENDKSNKLDLGLLRRPQKSSDIAEENDSWVPLIKNVNTLQILYFRPEANTWVDRWSDGNRLPRLIKLVVGRADTATPWEVIIPLGRIPWDLPITLRQRAGTSRQGQAITTASQGRGAATAERRITDSRAAIL
jgi:prepilin-type N-terminal cleavage/methylation domain-containing protein